MRVYEIRAKGHLDRGWSERFDAEVTATAGPPARSWS